MRTQQQAVGIDTKNNAIAFFVWDLSIKLPNSMLRVPPIFFSPTYTLNTFGLLFKHS